MRTTSLLVMLVVLVAAGCSGKPHAFLSVPDVREQKIESGALTGVPRMTKVEPATYDDYERMKKAGNVIAEEQYGGYLYFATSMGLCVPMTNPGPGQADRGAIILVMRFKVPLPAPAR